MPVGIGKLAVAKGPDHLAERMAQRLGSVGGLGTSGLGTGNSMAPDQRPGGAVLPKPPPIRADSDATVHHVGPLHGADPAGDIPPPPNLDTDATPHDDPRHHAPRHEAGPAQGGQPGALVLDRPSRPLPAPAIIGDMADRPVVDLDTGLPAPLVLDLVTMERAGMVVGRKARTRISEEFRVAVGQILRSVRGSYTPGRGAGNLVMVTSARPGEGKSFSSLNLAGSIAQHTQREVLLVDVDAKQNALSDQLGIGDRLGVIDLALTPGLRIEDTIVRTIIPNLTVLPVGVRRVDSLEGGAEGTVARPITALIERVGRRFANHIVILDAPPCLSTSDPSTLAPFVGQILMVVEAERTQRAEVLAALDLVKACPTITLMLNKIQVTTSYTFGAYHYFGSYS